MKECLIASGMGLHILQEVDSRMACGSERTLKKTVYTGVRIFRAMSISQNGEN